jgi:hypothetical protein
LNKAELKQALFDRSIAASQLNQSGGCNVFLVEFHIER